MMKRAPGIETVRQRFASANEPVQEVALSPESCGLGGESEDVSIPPPLAKKISERRQAAEAAADFGAMPQAGQIVRIPTANVAEPSAVLLDAPLKGSVWHGWMVSRDAGYATEWDFVLGPEEDPRDPFCQLVQVWNPVTPSIADADCVLARLSDERLNAVRVMAKDYARRFVPAPIADTRMGVILARELSDGTGVVTGTPIGSPSDPRREYRDIYTRVGESISQHGLVQISRTENLPATSSAQPGWLTRWTSMLFGAGQPVWKPAAAFAALVAVPLLIVFVIGRSPEQHQPIATGPVDVPANRYISGGQMQELAVTSPAETAKQIEARLRKIGVAPELRYEAGGLIVIIADLSHVPPAERDQLIADYALKLPATLILQVTLVQKSAGGIK